ncbi:hypothetical protein G3I39_23130, partial [Streptomyces fulvissimus]
ADAIQSYLANLLSSPPGEDLGLPDIPDSAVVLVGLFQPLQILLIGDGPSKNIRKGAPAPRSHVAARQRKREATVKAEAFGITGVQPEPEHAAGAVEGGGLNALRN